MEFVIRRDQAEVLGINEPRLRQALDGGQKEVLSKFVRTQWGAVRLWDLVLRFGSKKILKTVLALELIDVPGCDLQIWHLGDLPDARNAARPQGSGCGCIALGTCHCCCFGYSKANGQWMEDAHANVLDAALAARKASQTELVSSLQQICAHQELHLAISRKAAKKLLDIFNLCGDTKASRNFAESCRVRPLRRWAVGFLGEEVWQQFELPAVLAALAAGANFQNLCIGNTEIPVLLWLALWVPSAEWQQYNLGRCFPMPLWPSELKPKLPLGDLFYSQCPGQVKISMAKVQDGKRAGWNLKHVQTVLRDGAGPSRQVTLQDLAVASGLPDCARVLANYGVKPTCFDWIKQACHGKTLFLRSNTGGFIVPGTASACKSAAFAVAQGCLPGKFKGAVQVMSGKFNDIPAAVVDQILSFCMEAPQMLKDLDLTDGFGWLKRSEEDLWLALKPLPSS